MKHWLAVATLFACTAAADGVQVIGTPPCPLGMDGVKFYVGTRHVATICMAKAELERAHYVSGPGMGTVSCSVLVVR